MKIIRFLTSFVLFFTFIFFIESFFNIQTLFSADLTDPREIIRLVDNNLVPESSKSQTTMIIHERGREYEKQMTSYGEGQKRSYAEFSNPPRDKGTKFLKIEDNMWMYMPSVEKVIKIAGHMLRQSMMGSDFSYEDILEAHKLLQKYNPILLKKEQLKGRGCYVLELTAITHNVTYYRRILWVDAEHFVILRSELYAKTGKLLKLLNIEKVEKFGARYYPVHIIMEDKLRENTKTELISTSIEFNIAIPEVIFSRQNLERR